MELGLADTKQSKSNDCAIHLKADINNDCRYFAYHNTGLHAVSIEFIPELERYFSDTGKLVNSHENSKIEYYVSPCFADNQSAEPFLDKPSHVEYIVCTKALETAKANPVLGFTLLQSPSGLILFLASGQIVTLELISNPAYARHLIDAKSIQSASKSSSSAQPKPFADSFEAHIRSIFSSGSSQPILKLSNTKELTDRDALELLMHASQTLREQHIERHDKARTEIEKRVRILQLLKAQQQQEVAQLLNEQTQIRANAEHLAEMYEEANDRQQALNKRLHDILRVINLKMPYAAVVEKNFGGEIEKIAAKTKDLARNISLLQKKIEKQQMVATNERKNNTKRVQLQPKQEATIKEILGET